MDFTFPAHFHDLGQDFWSKILPTPRMSDREWTLERSRPSLVETSFSESVLRTLASHIMKAPWWVLGNSYQFTGGWEVFIKRKWSRVKTKLRGGGQVVKGKKIVRQIAPVREKKQS